MTESQEESKTKDITSLQLTVVSQDIKDMENVNGNNPANNKISSTAKTNKNAVLRKSKSCLEMTTSNKETLSHSKSFNVKPLHGCSSQVSIPECDADNANQTAPCNIHLTQSSDKHYDNTVYKIGEIRTPPSLPLPNQQKTSHHSVKFHQQIIQQNLPQEEQPQQMSNDLQRGQNHKDSQQLQDNIQMAVTSKATSVAATDSIITSTTSTTSKAIVTTSRAIAASSRTIATASKTTYTTPRAIATSTAIATSSRTTSFTSKAITKTSTAIATSTVGVTLKQQLLPSTSPHLKLSEKSLEPTLASHFTFSPPIPNITNYSTWLPQFWQNTKVEPFHDDQPSLNQPEAEETTDISTEAAPTDHGLSHGKQAQPKTTVCKTPTGTLSTMSRSRSVTCSNHPQPLSTSLSAPAGTTDFKDSTPQKTTPAFTLNDLGSSRISVHGELSVIENSPVSSASLVFADYASVPHSTSSPQLSSVQSWRTMSLKSLMCPTKSSNSSSYSLPIARVSPTASSTGSISTKEKRRDFILLSAGADQEEAEKYKAHLKIDIGIPDLTIDLFSDIDSGRTAVASSETLHERYNNILVLGTINLAGDRYSRFLHENVLTKGLLDANGKEDRVIPVWTSHDCKHKIMEFISIPGFQYYNFLSDKPLLALGYVKSVETTVIKGRNKCR